MAETNINVGLNEGTGDINETEAQEVLQEDALMDESDLDDLDAEAAASPIFMDPLSRSDITALNREAEAEAQEQEKEIEEKVSSAVDKLLNGTNYENDDATRRKLQAYYRKHGLVHGEDGLEISPEVLKIQEDFNKFLAAEKMYRTNRNGTTRYAAEFEGTINAIIKDMPVKVGDKEITQPCAQIVVSKHIAVLIPLVYLTHNIGAAFDQATGQFIRNRAITIAQRFLKANIKYLVMRTIIDDSDGDIKLKVMGSRTALADRLAYKMYIGGRRATPSIKIGDKVIGKVLFKTKNHVGFTVLGYDSAINVSNLTSEYIPDLLESTRFSKNSELTLRVSDLKVPTTGTTQERLQGLRVSFVVEDTSKVPPVFKVGDSVGATITDINSYGTFAIITLGDGTTISMKVSTALNGIKIEDLSVGTEVLVNITAIQSDGKLLGEVRSILFIK